MANVAPNREGVAPMEIHAGPAGTSTATTMPNMHTHPGLLQEFSAKGVLLGCCLLASIVALRWGTFAQTVLLLWVGYAAPYVSLWVLRVAKKNQASIKLGMSVAVLSVIAGAFASATLLKLFVPDTPAVRSIFEAAALTTAFSTALLTLAFWTSLKLEISTRLAVNRERAMTQREALQKQIVLGKLQVLQAQVEPHFLYNTLAHVQQLISAQPNKASELLENLINYLRASLPRLREKTAIFGNELELVRAYLGVMQVRMGDRFSVKIDVDDSLFALPFPPLLLMPLVENAIKHGIELKPGPVTICVAASRSGKTVSIVISDDGVGFQAPSGEGVGLANVRDRLKALFGSAASLALSENDVGGVSVEITIAHEALCQLH